MIETLICLLIAIVLAAAFLAIVRAVLALPPMAGIAPYGGVFYAVAVLIVLLLVIKFCLPQYMPH